MISSGSLNRSPDSDGSVLGWAQTRPGPTRGQPYKPQRERPKVVFPAFAYSHIPNSSSRWVSHLHTNSSKTPGPVLISTSVFLMQSIQGKFKTHFGHGSAALTEIHERTGPTVQHLGDRARCKKRDHILKACLR